MKDSGIDWIGKIPVHWKFMRFKQIGKLSAGGTPSTSKSSYWDNGTIPWISSGEVNNNTITDYITKITKLGLEESSTRLFPKGSVLLAITGQGKTRGRTAVLEIDACTNQSVVGIIPDNSKIFNYFLWYYIQSQYWHLRSHSQGSVQSGLNLDILKNYSITFSSIKEQKQIVQYLNANLSKIDSEISRNQNLIELLREKKQSTINQAVTTGLDPKVTMKDSDVEWIEDIPVKWNLDKIKFSSFVKGRVGWQGLRSDELVDEGPYLITGTDFSEGNVDWKKCYHVEQWRYNLDPHIQVQNKDLLITKDGTIGKLAYVENLPGLATLNSHLLLIRPLKNKYTTRFLYWVFKSDNFNYYVNLTQKGTTFNALSQEKIEEFIFAYPDINEQNKITLFLDNQTSKIDSEISKTDNQINKFHEFRQSLIYAAVTGKIDVRDVMA